MKVLVFFLASLFLSNNWASCPRSKFISNLISMFAFTMEYAPCARQQYHFKLHQFLPLLVRELSPHDQCTDSSSDCFIGSFPHDHVSGAAEIAEDLEFYHGIPKCEEERSVMLDKILSSNKKEDEEPFISNW